VKRDMDLVRHILIETEKADEPFDLDVIASRDERYPLALVAYHVELMVAHGLLDAEVSYAWGHEVTGGTIEGLTWDGTDYLDAIRDGSVWAKTKKVVADAVGSTTMEVIKQTAVLVAVEMVKAKLGISTTPYGGDK